MACNSSASSSKKHYDGSRKNNSAQGSRRAAGSRRSEASNASSRISTSPSRTPELPELIEDTSSCSGSFSSSENEVHLPHDSGAPVDEIDLDLDMLSLSPGADPLRPQTINNHNLSLQDIVNEFGAAGDSPMDRFLDDTSDLLSCHIGYGGEKTKKSTKRRIA